MKKISVRYIISASHSGSTLTDLLLGTHPDIEGLGEVKALADLRNSNNGGECTCGKKLDACPVWSRVLGKTAETGMQIDHNTPDSDNFQSFNEAMFREIHDFTNARALIDSSKALDRFQRMRSSALIRPVLIHLVRDGRAVAWSNTRKGRDFDTTLEDWARKQKAVADYCRDELAPAEWVRVRYEDIVADPALTLEPVFASLGVSQNANLSGWAERTKHNLGGNRMRKSADGTIKLDAE